MRELRLESVQVGEKIGHLLFIKSIAEGRHQVVPMQDDRRDAVVIGGRAAGQIFLLVERLESGTVKRAVAVRIMAAGAVRGVDLVSGGFLRSEFTHGFRGRQRRPTAGEEKGCGSNEKDRTLRTCLRLVPRSKQADLMILNPAGD
jgi:hypothetical protein